jgi:hypothetical protein
VVDFVDFGLEVAPFTERSFWPLYRGSSRVREARNIIHLPGTIGPGGIAHHHHMSLQLPVGIQATHPVCCSLEHPPISTGVLGLYLEF